MATQQDITTYIALFHHRDLAAAAIEDLRKAGFPTDAFTILSGSDGSAADKAQGTFGPGFNYSGSESLGSVGVPERDRKHLQDGLNQGGTVLVLKGAEERSDEIEKIFHKHATGKIDETDVERAGSAPVAAGAAVPFAAAESTVIPVTQEELVVGKREVDRGGVRVFRRTVEEPVTESVNLHEEHVVIERRPVNRAVTDAELRQGDRAIELTETAEEAVVGKSARVVEEIHVGKQATDHTETIRDTVRHTEVEVEQIPAGDLTSATNTARKQ